MVDDLGRVNLIPNFLDRGAREEPYHGRHGRKPQPNPDRAGENPETAEKEPDEPAAGSHVDLRI